MYFVLTALSIVVCFTVTSNAESALHVPIVFAQGLYMKAGLLDGR